MGAMSLSRRQLLKSAGVAAAGSVFTGCAFRQITGTGESRPNPGANIKIDQTDVLVVGGGTGGVAAAIAAARANASVVMLERELMVGGTITGSYVVFPCGTPINGIYGEMAERLRARYAQPAGSRWFLPFSWQVVINEMLDEAGVRVVCGARNVLPIVEDVKGQAHVRGARLAMADGNERYYRAAVTVDATGSGEFSASAGCESRYGTEARSEFNEPHAPEEASDFVQHCTIMGIIQKIGSGPAFDMTLLSKGRAMEAGIGWFKNDKAEAVRRDAGVYLVWGGAAPCRDTRDPMALAETQATILRMMQPDIDLLWEHGYAIHLAPRLGVREVRRIVGEHVITECDLRSGKLPEDTIALGEYELDLWGGNISLDESYLPVYGIPYRALVPRGVEGLLLAGKSISGSHIAMSAYRVQPILSTYSQAAGVAAAWCVRRIAQPRDVNVVELREALRRPEQGVILDETSHLLRTGSCARSEHHC